jgi:hypothetical protein
MLVQLFSPHAPQVLARPWLPPVHPQSSENVICDKMVFFARSACFFILEHYFSTRSYAECQNAFRNSFPDSVVPNKSTIQRLVELFRENPHLFHDVPLHSLKTGSWCAISRKRIVGPTFFSDCWKIQRDHNAVISLLNEERFCWLQQDGATSHTANSTTEMLNQYFDDRIISNHLWSPRSPDLTPPDYFLWGYLK